MTAADNLTSRLEACYAQCAELRRQRDKAEADAATYKAALQVALAELTAGYALLAAIAARI